MIGEGTLVLGGWSHGHSDWLLPRFEDLMKSVVLTSVSQHLGQHLFPYWLLLVSSAPFTWIMLDLAVENLLFVKLRCLVAVGGDLKM